MKDIGVDIKVANELDPKRARFYQEVYPDTHMICGDSGIDIALCLCEAFGICKKEKM